MSSNHPGIFIVLPSVVGVVVSVAGVVERTDAGKAGTAAGVSAGATDIPNRTEITATLNIDTNNLLREVLFKTIP